jgi:hypothetical protein
MFGGKKGISDPNSILEHDNGNGFMPLESVASQNSLTAHCFNNVTSSGILPPEATNYDFLHF